MKFKFKLRPKTVVLISVIIALVMIASSYIELSQSRKEIFNLLYQHSSSLLENVIRSSENALNASYQIEDLITERLLNSARLIKRLDSLSALDQKKLIDIGRENNLFRINIFDKRGFRILSNRIPEPGHIHGEENINRSEELAQILDGSESEIIIGLKKAEFADEERYAVAIARANNRGAIVVNLDAKDFLEFRKSIGIGAMLQDMTAHHGVVYIVLQDKEGVLAASKNIDSVESINNSSFLIKTMDADSVYSRIITYSGNEVYETVKRFVFDDELIGIYRMGVPLEDIKNVEQRMIRRLIIISAILAAIAIIVLSIIFTTQNLQSVSNEFSKFKTLTSSVLENLAEAVIVTDKENKIVLVNQSASEMFKVNKASLIGKDVSELSGNNLKFLYSEINKAYDPNSIVERKLFIDGVEKIFVINLFRILDEGKKENTVITIRDITETRKLEEEAQKNEKLSAMGELASGVAHEIRNPINSIGMIAQRLQKEFIPENGQDEYHNITKLLRYEVDRINKIITQFLNYAKPLEINIKEVNSASFFNEIYLLMESQAKQRNISFIKQDEDNFILQIDPDLIKQALLNIIQNAIDAVNKDGKVKLVYKKFDKFLKIEIIDNGHGIPEDKLKKIFDLYFTTKKDGNGLGLSIAQKIISQHKGNMEVSSAVNKGTTFKIILPQA